MEIRMFKSYSSLHTFSPATTPNEHSNDQILFGYLKYPLNLSNFIIT